SSKAVDLSQYGEAYDSLDVTSKNLLISLHDLPGGAEMFDAAGNHLGQALDFLGHSDRGRDRDGSDVIVMANAADRTPMPGCTNGIVKKTLPDGGETCLLSFGWGPAMHISCNNEGEGWCLVSTYTSHFN